MAIGIGRISGKRTENERIGAGRLGQWDSREAGHMVQIKGRL